MSKQKLTFGFSPCPNDTFILDALVNNKLNLEEDLEEDGIEFKWVIEDVQELNNRVLKRALDVSKISFGVYPNIIEDYKLMNSGSALGQACGPLVIYKKKPEASLKNIKVGIPGRNTTANFLLSKAYPEITDNQKIELLFSDIEDQLTREEIDLGLIIHESRFTYQSKGLYLLKDLGEFWEESTGLNLPLGGFCIKRQLDDSLQLKIQKWIRQSVEYAFKSPESSKEWIKKYSQEMDNEVIQSHIDLYVNEYSIDLGTKGRSAIMHLLDKAKKDEKKLKKSEEIFVT